ncbi:MAG: reverse transcriptase domain-containing protein, partial [Cyanobacteria bacterium J06614_10]
PLAKYMVPLLSSLTINTHTLLNSSDFIPQILSQNAKYFMVSFDVCSLFTNVPLFETIDLILSKLFSTDDAVFNGYDKKSFRKLLELSVLDTHFVFDGKLFKQVEGMAMGSPLGPTFANIFMCHLEEQYLSQCPSNFKPVFYKRYVDDTFVLFKDPSHANMFLNFINNFHNNIKFTLDSESDGQLSFLDILVSRNFDKFETSVFRKNTFTGLGLNFFSYCSLNFKLNSCRTLLHRAFSVCSTWAKFHDEIRRLTKYFQDNCYPSHIFPRFIKKFLDQKFQPPVKTLTVPKKNVYISLPYMGNFSYFCKSELTSCLSKLYPYVKFNFVFKNTLSIGSLFRFKDTLPELMRSNVVYSFTCPKCNFGTYIGCTSRLLKVRIDSHMGVSYRTNISLSRKEESAVRSHSDKCRSQFYYEDFKILGQASSRSSLLFLESLYIKQLNPKLNSSTTSVPLQIA